LQGSVKIVHETAVVAEATFLADMLGTVLKEKATLKHVPISGPGIANSIRLRVADFEVAGATKRRGDEAYVLTVSPNEGIEIVGTDPAGVFYGVQTLRALLPIDSYRQANDHIAIEAVQIADAPRFRYRGLHLDVARNFQTKSTVLKLLDLMALYKLNRFHWHLTDDEGWRLEIKSLPELTAVGARRGHTLTESDRLIPSQGSGPYPDAAISPGTGYYSQEDVVEILLYAHARHITVIPEIDFPGHARAAIKAMEARHNRLAQKYPAAANEFLLREPGDESKYESVQMWRDNVVDVGREATYRFLDIVFGELSEIYQRASVPLTSIHLGGDEVPNGVWEKSPACERIPINADSKILRRGQLELHFLDRAAELVARRSIQPACWEDCLLLEAEHDKSAAKSRRAAGRPVPTACVWNNVWGWGREDAAYRLANAGFDVVLCNATHLYFDLACEKDPQEPGYYWAGFVGMRAPFEFVPLDVFKNAAHNSMGQPVSEDSLAGRARVTKESAAHILGIQGQLWAENLRDANALDYMAFPRLIALAERAWARSPDWANIGDASSRRAKLDQDWNQFANRLGQRELPRLDLLGVQYRLPPPGAVVRSGMVYANIAFPGVVIRYTTDGSEPDQSSPAYSAPFPMAREVKLKSFNTTGSSSRSVQVGDGD
jgi:hexosaminidase